MDPLQFFIYFQLEWVPIGVGEWPTRFLQREEHRRRNPVPTYVED